MKQKISISGENGYVILYGFALDNSVRAYFVGDRNLEAVDRKIEELQGFGSYTICVFYTDEFHGFN